MIISNLISHAECAKHLHCLHKHCPAICMVATFPGLPTIQSYSMVKTETLGMRVLHAIIIGCSMQRKKAWGGRSCHNLDHTLTLQKETTSWKIRCTAAFWSHAYPPEGNQLCPELPPIVPWPSFDLSLTSDPNPWGQTHEGWCPTVINSQPQLIMQKCRTMYWHCLSNCLASSSWTAYISFFFMALCWCDHT